MDVFSCPQCRRDIPRPQQYVGERVRCPQCRSYVSVPPADDSPVPLTPPPDDETSGDVRPRRGRSGGLPRLARHWGELGPHKWWAAGLTAVLLVILVTYVSGAPLRATRRAFEDLKALDQSGQLSTPQPYDIIRQRFPQSNAQQLVELLSKVAPHLFANDDLGQWVLCGRLVKYFATMDPSYGSMRDCLKDLRAEAAPPVSEASWHKGCDALLTIARQYHRSSALKRRCREDLAKLLKVSPDYATVAQALRNYQDEVVAWEAEQTRQRQLDEERQRQAQQQRNAALSQRLFGQRSRPAYAGPSTGYRPSPTMQMPPPQSQFVTCPECKGSRKCPACSGFGGNFNMPGRPTKDTCPVCSGTGTCQSCGGTGKRQVDAWGGIR